MEEGQANDDEDKVIFDSMIKQEDELDDIGLLLTQPGSSASNETAGTAMTPNPPAPSGPATGPATGPAQGPAAALQTGPATGPATGPENPELPSSLDEKAAGASTGETVPAISISSPGDESGNGDDMVVDGGSPRPLPVLVREQEK